MAAGAKDIDAALDRIREKLARAGKTLNPPASEDDAAEFEEEHGIVLPPDYRAFILTVGDGGDGPDDRLHPLWSGYTDPMEFMAVRGDLHLEDGKPPSRFIRLFDSLAAMQLDPGQELRGLLVLCDDGAGIAKMLCLHGREYGRILRVEGEDSEISLSYFDDFLGWYEAWLDDTLRGWHTHYHGSYMPGDETSLIDVAASKAPGHIRRAAIHSLFRRMPTLSDAALTVLRRLAHDERDRDVRKDAAHTLRYRAP